MAESEGVFLEDLAGRLGGRLVCGGGVDASVVRICGVGVPGEVRAGDIVYASNLKNLKVLSDSPCAALIIGEGLAPEAAPGDLPPEKPLAEKPLAGKPLVIVADSKKAFISCLEIFAPRYEYAQGVSPEANVRESARVAASAVVMERVSVMDGALVGERTQLFPGVFVGAGARIGCDCVLHPNVVIREGCVLGDRVIIHAGAVIGADGFGYTQSPDGSHHKIPQIGNVVIEDDVEIGANSTVDRAACGSTRIGRGSKIDNLVQVAHNVIIGKNNILAAQVGIAGSTTTGDSCVFAGQAGIADHCTLGDRVVIGPQAGVQRRRISSDTMYMGTPAIEMKKLQKILPYFHRLPELLGDKKFIY
jgi:UDP-3-O-[3-hydroxymyristoyl] glucosamine N-acyltransferase